MGPVTARAQIENLQDLHLARTGHLNPAEVRKIEVEALVDTGMTGLGIPSRLIRQLGLTKLRTRSANTTAGPREYGVFSGVQVLIQGRDFIIDVTEVPDTCPVLIGQVPLELLDFVVDPVHQRLIGNPEHGGEHMIDMY
jgi:clan AA aspartic protease